MKYKVLFLWDKWAKPDVYSFDSDEIMQMFTAGAQTAASKIPSVRDEVIVLTLDSFDDPEYLKRQDITADKVAEYRALLQP